MALVKCKECQNQVSSKAEKCPHCGAVVKKKTSGCAVIFLIVLLLAVIGPVMREATSDNQPSSVHSASSAPSSASSSPINAAPSNTANMLVPIPAKVVYNYYEANEVKADNDLKNKWGIVTGKISKIGKDIMDTPYVALDSNDEIFSVQCMFTNAGEIRKLADLSIGQDISIAGTCKGKMGNVL
jgi:hypothetical protein